MKSEHTQLDIYERIQPLVQLEIDNRIKEQSNENRFTVASVTAHTHNGTDSLQVNFPDLVEASTYMAIQRITLTPAQIKALFTTPITLVPAINPTLSPSTGARAYIIVTEIEAQIKFSTTAYAGANNFEFRYTDASGAKVTADMASTFINSASTAYDHVAGVTTELVPVINAPIVVTVPVANPTLGDSPITFVVHYYVTSFA